MTKKALLRTVTCLLLLLSVSVATHGDDRGKGQYAREYTKEHPLIYEDAWNLWPYVFLDEEGVPCGYNIDLLAKIFAELRIPYEVHLKPTSEAFDDLRGHHSDLMFGMVANFHDDYTLYYGKTTIHMFTHSVAHIVDKPQLIHDIDDLGKEKVIVHDGSFSHHLMQDQGMGHNALPYADMDKAVQMVSAEGKGVILWNTMSLKWLIHKYHANNLTLSPVDIPSGDYRLMSNDSVLLERMEQAYAHLKSTEQLQPLEMKWFYPEDSGHTGIPLWLEYVAMAIGVLVLILSIATLAYYIRERRVTHDIRVRNARLALILKACQVRMWTYDVKKRLITWYGEDAHPSKTYTVEEFGRRYDPKEFEMLRKAVLQLVHKQRDEVSLELHVVDETDEKLHTFSVVLSVLASADGQPNIIIGTKRDITEECELQQHTDTMMKRYQALFTTAMVDMVYYDKDGYLAHMNERAQATFGMTLQEARERRINVIDTLDNFNGRMEYCHLTNFLTPSGAIQQRDHLLPLKDCMCYEMQLVPVVDSASHLLGIYATGRNVSEAARTYRKAQENVKQLRNALIELDNYVNNINYTMQVGGVRTITYLPDTHTLTINHRMHEAQYVLTQQRCLDLVDPLSMRQAMRLFRAMDRRKNMPMESEIKTSLRIKGNKRVWLLVQLFPVFGDNGIIKEYYGICRDTTEIKFTERMLKQETEKAQEVEHLKNKFLHNMCYEIRTPLDVVVENAERFEHDHKPEEEAAFIDTIKTNSAYLLNLINDILFLSRLDAQMVEFSPLPCDFSKTFESHCQSGWNNFRKEGVSYTVENHYESLVVDIDDINVGRIIEQVVQNAAEHTDSGYVRARYEYIGGKLIVVVDDTGSGIEPDVLEHIFERFNTTASKNHRTGLGMPICKELATQMGGTIDVKSEPGKGTNVWITIPCEATVAERRKDI